VTNVDLGWLEIARARYGALLDRLTGLPNTPLLFDRLTVALARARRNQTYVALYVLEDPRSFRSQGFHLQNLVADLQAQLRADDKLARIGEQRLAILCTDLRADEDAALLARRLIHHAGVICQLGVAMGTADDAPEELLARAVTEAARAAPARRGRDPLKAFRRAVDN